MHIQSRKLLIIVICLNLLIPVVNASRKMILNERFETSEIGTLPKGWTKKTSVTSTKSTETDEMSVEMDFAAHGRKSLRLREYMDGSNAWVHSSDFETYIKKNFEVSFSFMIQGGASARAVFKLLDENEDKAIGVNCRLGDDWRYSCGESFWWTIPNLPTPEPGVEYKVSIILDKGNERMRVIINGDKSDWIPIWTGWEYISKVGFHNNDNHPSEFWIDDLIIRETNLKK
jgi:hypothetical protein